MGGIARHQHAADAEAVDAALMHPERSEGLELIGAVIGQERPIMLSNPLAHALLPADDESSP